MNHYLLSDYMFSTLNTIGNTVTYEKFIHSWNTRGVCVPGSILSALEVLCALWGWGRYHSFLQETYIQLGRFLLFWFFLHINFYTVNLGRMLSKWNILKFRQRNSPLALIFREYFPLEMGTNFGFQGGIQIRREK